MNEDSGNPLGGINNSTRPYILRALHEWALDNGFTPQVLVNVDVEHVSVPTQFVNNGRIILNIHPDSVRELELDNSHICFYARFSGKPHYIYLPIDSIMAIFARENGQGIAFPVDHERATSDESSAPSLLGEADEARQDEEPKQQQPKSKKSIAKRQSHLKIVK